MNPFADDRPLRITLNDDPLMWVDLRRELTIAVEDSFQAKMFNAKFDKDKAVAGKLDPKDIELNVDIGRAMSTAAKLEMWIVDWQLYDREGGEVELSDAAIGKLSKATTTILLDAIKALEGDAERLGERSTAPPTET